MADEKALEAEEKQEDRRDEREQRERREERDREERDRKDEREAAERREEYTDEKEAEERKQAGNLWEGEGEMHRAEHRYLRERVAALELENGKLRTKVDEWKMKNSEEPEAEVTETEIVASGTEQEPKGEEADREKTRKGTRNSLFF